MNVRKFIAPTVAEALAAVKRDLGEDAVILRTRAVTEKGKVPLLAREMVEVMAAPPDRSPPDETTTPGQVASILQRLDRRSDPRAVTDLKEEISQLRGKVQSLAEQVKGDRSSGLSDAADLRFRSLLAVGVETKIAMELAEGLDRKTRGDHSATDARKLDTTLVKMIARRIRVRRPSKKNNGAVKVIAMVGPTGVGKTTTLAKLVTSYRHWGNLDTAIVSADTYRVAALEQIKTFASIAGLPMEAVYTPAAMPAAIARHKGRDAIFVDTPGRSQSDTQKLDELIAFLDAANADERLLCLAVNTRLEDQLDIIERYGKLNPTGIVFTKLDDSRHPGGILGVSASTDIPFTYLTCGQNVPDDVVFADEKRIAELLVHTDSLPKLQKERFAAWISADEAVTVEATNG